MPLRAVRSWWSLLLILMLAFAVGCGQSTPKVSLEDRFDEEVETSWQVRWKWVDAIPFFENGGMYTDTGDPGDPQLDRAHVMPLLKRLGEEFQLSWKAVVGNKNEKNCMAVVAALPDEPGLRGRIEASLRQHEADFPGDILQQWGKRWVSLDFLNEKQVKFFEQDERAPATPNSAGG